MKKKLLLITLMVALFVCAFAISASAANRHYMSYEVVLSGETEPTTVYTYSKNGDFDMNEGRFYINDLVFTEAPLDNSLTYTALDTTKIVKMDFTNAKFYKFDKLDADGVTPIYITYEYSTNQNRFYICGESPTAANYANVKEINTGKTTIFSSAFRDWTGLEKVVFSANPLNSVLKINADAFRGCSALHTIEFDDAITSIELGGQWVFAGTAITSIDLSKVSNTNIPSNTFRECSSLTNVTFQPGIKSIDENAFYACSAITSINIPSTVTSIGKYAFKQTGLTSVDLSGTGVTKIQQDSFRECKSLKTVKMPPVLSAIEAEAFRDCAALEFVDFGNNTAETFAFTAHRTFYNCGELRGVSLPRNTTEMNNGTFALCKKLDALYIGDAMIRINGNKGDAAGDGPTFAECYVMYFVQNPFSVTKEDGSFYSVTEWESVKPAKPEIYYFPSTLKRICGAHNINDSFVMDKNGHVQNVGAGDLAFVKCYNLNKYLVFPEGFTGVDESKLTNNNATENENQRGDTLSSGLFHHCATEENPITLVFMGRIDRISMDRKDGQTSYMTYMFANPANTGFENTTIGSYLNNSGYSNQNEMYVVFCHAAGGAQRYKINFVASETDKNTPVLSPTLVVDGATHVNNPRNTADRSAAANCVDNQMTFDICFCGTRCNITEVENTALGHDLDYAKDDATAALISVIYENGFTAEGVKTVCCGREGCEVKGELTAEIILSGFGYSTRVESEAKSGVVFSYLVNRNALNDYETANKTTVTLGVLAVAEHKATDTPIGADGTANMDNVVAAPVGTTNAVDLIIWGSPKAWEETDKETGKAVKEIAFYFAAYVIENESVSYICNSSSDKLTDLAKKTYAQIVAEAQA